MNFKQICFSMAIGFAGTASAHPYTTPNGQTNIQVMQTSTKSTELVTTSSSKDDRGGWGAANFSVNHNSTSISVARGLSDTLDLTAQFVYKVVKNNGIWGPVEQSDEFSGWADANFSMKYAIYRSEMINVAGIGAFNAPANEYNANKLISPGIATPEYVLGVSLGVAELNVTNLLGTIDYGRAFRTGRAPDQDRYSAAISIVEVFNMSISAFYGGVKSLGGINIGSSEFESYVGTNDDGNFGMPFPRVDEAYQYAGASVGSSAYGLDVYLSYSEKLLAGARNTDISRSWSIGVGCGS